METGKMKEMPTDIEIAQSIEIKKIIGIAEKIGLTEDDLFLYGKYMAKIEKQKLNELKSKLHQGQLILVTAINPTAAGEGKTTTGIGLADALKRIGKNTVICLREPSQGPCFGVKGGATGGGYAQVVPMEKINLHFTGDIHAVTSAHNQLAARIDSSLFHGNPLNIDPNSITFPMVMDVNHRAVRKAMIAIDGNEKSVPRKTEFHISVASEIMAILCLSTDLKDMEQRFAKIVIGYTYDGDPVTVSDLQYEGAMTALMEEAFSPNLAQTLEGTPAIIHGGPFANIAHGCNSIIATDTALKLADYVVTETGFGADLGAEKFLDLKCRIGNFTPAAIVIVATARALKLHGGINKNDLKEENLDAISKGFANLEKHIENIKKYNVPLVVTINRFGTDTEAELDLIKNKCIALGVSVEINNVHAQGGLGGIDLAKKVLAVIENEPNNFKFLYDEKLPIKDKIEIIAKEIYGADGVKYSEQAETMINKLNVMGYDKLPICISKTQYSLSDNPKKLGRPINFVVEIREIRLSAGAGFIVAIAGDIMTMPGLPKDPAGCRIGVNHETGKIKGLF